MNAALAMMFAAGATGPQYATWNPADKGAAVVLTNNNLTISGASIGSVRATVGKSTGKWYWEVTLTTGSGYLLGVGLAGANLSSFVGGDVSAYGWLSSGQIYNNGVVIATAAPFSNSNVLGFALDVPSQLISFGVNNSFTSPISLSAFGGGPTIFPMASVGNGNTDTANFGATPFVYTPPAGFTGGIEA